MDGELSIEKLNELHEEIMRNRMQVVGTPNAVNPIREQLERLGFTVKENKYVPSGTVIILD